MQFYSEWPNLRLLLAVFMFVLLLVEKFVSISIQQANFASFASAVIGCIVFTLGWTGCRAEP